MPPSVVSFHCQNSVLFTHFLGIELPKRKLQHQMTKRPPKKKDFIKLMSHVVSICSTCFFDSFFTECISTKYYMLYDDVYNTLVCIVCTHFYTTNLQKKFDFDWIPYSWITSVILNVILATLLPGRYKIVLVPRGHPIHTTYLPILQNFNFQLCIYKYFL